MTTNLIYAPWSGEQVSALNTFQQRGNIHPFTCGAVHSSGRSPLLVATSAGWICPDPSCDYTQDWAHAFMAASAVVAVAAPPTGQTRVQTRVEPVNPCTRGESFCGQHGYDCPPTGQPAPTVWIDGHPQLEAIAAAVWESCQTEDTSLVVDDPRNIAVAAYAAVLAVLPAGSEDTTTTRADVLLGVADRLKQKADALTEGLHDLAAFVAKARIAEAEILDREADELRRLAAETQQTRPGCPDPIECNHEAALGQAEEKLEAVHALGTAWSRPSMSAPTRVAGEHLLRLLDAPSPAVVSAVPPQPEETA